MDAQGLWTVLATRDLDKVAAALVPLSEIERRALREPLAEAIAAHYEHAWWRLSCEVCEALELALFGIEAVRVVRKQSLGWSTEPHERLLRARDRRWRQQILERPRRFPCLSWPVVYRAVRDGLADRPAKPWYLAEGAHRADLWADDPHWLAHEYWELFTDEGAAHALSSYHNVGGVLRGRVEEHIALIRSGAIKRDRQLDAAMMALLSDFAPRDTPFYRALIDALDPSAGELAERTGSLIALLASNDVADIAFALRHLSTLADASRVPAAETLSALGPGMQVRIKKHALAAVRLAGRLLDGEPGLAAAGLPALTGALTNPLVDVQRAALDVIERHRAGLGELEREYLGALLPEADPALRDRIRELAGTNDTVPLASRGVPATAEVIRRTGSRKLSPVATAGELFERLLAFLRHGDDPDEIELLIDGLLRVDTGEIDRDGAAALHRAGAPSFFRFGVQNPAQLLSYLMRKLIGLPDHEHGLPSAGDSPLEAILARAREALEVRDYAGLLSAPTHSGGWIDPMVAAQRLARLADAEPKPMDLAQLVLRLARDGRAKALAAARTLDSEAGAVLVRALGGEFRRPAGPSNLEPAWSAAEQARDPRAYRLGSGTATGDLTERQHHDGMEFPRPYIGGPSPFLRPLLPDIAPESPATLLELPNVWQFDSSRTAVGAWERWLTTVWPDNHDACYRIAAQRLWVAVDGHGAEGTDVILELLLDPPEPVSPQATLALSLALGNGDAGLQGLAIDALITTVATGRLDGAALGQTLSFIFGERRGKGDFGRSLRPAIQRWVKPLTELGCSSELGALTAQVAAEEVLADTSDDDRRRVSGMVGLLRTLALQADAAVTNPAAREFLARYSPRSAGGRLAAEALAVTGTGARRSEAAAAQLTAARASTRG